MNWNYHAKKEVRKKLLDLTEEEINKRYKLNKVLAFLMSLFWCLMLGGTCYYWDLSPVVSLVLLEFSMIFLLLLNMVNSDLNFFQLLMYMKRKEKK